jgi:hypothetical protein
MFPLVELDVVQRRRAPLFIKLVYWSFGLTGIVLLVVESFFNVILVVVVRQLHNSIK